MMGATWVPRSPLHHCCDGIGARARKALAVVAVDHLEYSVADVAQLLRKHPGSVSRWLETPRGSGDRSELVSRILALITNLNPNNGKL